MEAKLREEMINEVEKDVQDKANRLVAQAIADSIVSMVPEDVIFIEIQDIGIYAVRAAALPELLDIYSNGKLSQTVTFYDGKSKFVLLKKEFHDEKSKFSVSKQGLGKNLTLNEMFVMQMTQAPIGWQYILVLQYE